MIGIPVDARFAFVDSRRRLLQSGDFLYNPPGTSFDDVHAFWYSYATQQWTKFEKQRLLSRMFMAVAPVDGLLLDINGYRIQMSVLVIQSTTSRI